jgi:DUF4097 and DUF4098 domain-containing protein YvlB
LTGPFLLILIGTIFLLQHLGGFSAFVLFARWWPLLLIIVGVIKLVEHLVYQYLDYPEARFGGGTVVLLILICVFGGLANAAYQHRDEIDWGEMHDHMGGDEGFWHLFGSEHEYDQQVEQSLPANATLRIVSNRGNVTVSSGDDAVIRVTEHKHVFADSNDEADRLNRECVPQFSNAGGNTLVLTATAVDNASTHTDLEVVVPRNVPVEISTRRGDVNVSNHNGLLHINDERGDISVDTIKGDVFLTLNHGTAHVSNIDGSLSIDGRTDNANLSQISGFARLEGEFNGDVHLEKIAKGLHFHSSISELSIASLTGSVDIDGGNLRLDQAAGPVSIRTQSKDIDARSVSGALKIENNAGNIHVEPATTAGDLTITSRHGDVELQMPAKASFQYQARTQHGEVKSEFDDIKLNNPDHGDSTGSGNNGKGGPHINVTSESGNIDLRKAS